MKNKTVLSYGGDTCHDLEEIKAHFEAVEESEK